MKIGWQLWLGVALVILVGAGVTAISLTSDDRNRRDIERTDQAFENLNRPLEQSNQELRRENEALQRKVANHKRERKARQSDEQASADLALPLHVESETSEPPSTVLDQK